MSGTGQRARADSMPARNADLGAGFSTDDLLRKITSKIAVGDSMSRNTDNRHDDNSHLRAPLNSRMASKGHLEMDKTAKQGQCQSIGSMSLKMQENAIIEDILFTMMGIEGEYITIVRAPAKPQEQEEEYTHRNFKPDDSLEAFVELHSRFEYGFVSHALCAAIRGLLKEYLILIAQLENQFRSSPDFTLQKLWYYIQPTMQTLSALDVLVGVIRDAGRIVVPEDDIDALLNPKEGIPLEAKGGSILVLIASGMSNMSGDPVTKKLYGYLLNKASVPYIAMLESWIHKGEIRDPYEEFMIVESRKVSKENIKEDFNDAYWEQRYTIREKYVPSFLMPLKTKILLAGKYLNVIRECGIHLSKTPSTDTSTPATDQPRATHAARNEILAALSGGNLVDSVEEAYQSANTKLLDLLLKERQLLGRLRSMKRYFFLDQSDYFTHFLDLASAELKQPSREVSLTKLQSLMDLVLRNPSSVTVNDIFKEDLKVDMSHLSLVDQLLRIIHVGGLTQGERVDSRASNPKDKTRSRANSGSGTQGMNDSWNDEGEPSKEGAFRGPSRAASSMEGIMQSGELPPQGKGILSGIDALTLDYSVKFPLSLVISRKALTKYQLLFRHLLYLKHGEQVLCHTWTEHAKSPVWKRASPELAQWRGRVYGLRARMLTFVQQFAYYVCSEVLEPNWRELASKLAKVSTVDQVLQIHSDFLDTCLNECMLTNSKLLRIYQKLMSTCIKFTNYTDKFTRALLAMETQLDPEKAVMAPANQVQLIEQAIRRLNEFEDGFIYHLKLLIEALNFYSATESVQFLCLVVRLDYNQFYANQNSQTLNLIQSSQP
ncbi:hypothetical protein BG006_002986 [Podila minutissima]|uniref:Spindle pole body component n=1 Tax=Podila minutissima TaxID=64525 RepID=A0A9P5SMP6_9FUNG|nr:hypothetical protein BG006_002986 [Podila minutissima]